MTSRERARRVIDELCDDPRVWLSHGQPRIDKLKKIERKIAEAIEDAREEEACSGGYGSVEV